MQALGLIETRGLVAAVESADAMLKAAEVKLLEKTIVGGGLVSIMVTGDVGAVKAAVDAGVAAVEQLNQNALVSQHVIPRPHESLEEIIILETPLSDVANIPVAKIENNVNIAADLLEAENMNLPVADSEVEQHTIQETEKDEEKKDAASENALIEVHKEDLDEQIKNSGVEAGMELLNDMNLQMLRNLANEYEDFKITGGSIAKANKKRLLAEFKKYYGQRQHLKHE